MTSPFGKRVAVGLQAGGGGLRLEHLGPVVVGAGGELQRIANWGALSERERETARRRLVRRNAERLAALGRAPPGADAGGGGGAGQPPEGPPRPDP